MSSIEEKIQECQNKLEELRFAKRKLDADKVLEGETVIRKLEWCKDCEVYVYVAEDGDSHHVTVNNGPIPPNTGYIKIYSDPNSKLVFGRQNEYYESMFSSIYLSDIIQLLKDAKFKHVSYDEDRLDSFLQIREVLNSKREEVNNVKS